MILSFVSHPKRKCPFSSFVTLAISKDVEENGSIIKKTCFEQFDTSVFLNSVVSSDFSVNNLLSIGATNLLKRNFSGDMPAVSNADVFESIPNNLNSSDDV